MRFLALALISLSLCLSSLATAPYAEIKFENLKISRKLQKRINREWFAHLKNKKELLYNLDKTSNQKQNYKSDQVCLFNGDLLEDGSIDLSSLKLIKQKTNNFDYNLAAIDFLRTAAYKFPEGKKQKNSKIKLSFRYFSF